MYFGTLKVKPRGQLRREEIYRNVPVFKVGSAYFVWQSNAARRRTQSARAKENVSSERRDLSDLT